MIAFISFLNILLSFYPYLITSVLRDSCNFDSEVMQMIIKPCGFLFPALLLLLKVKGEDRNVNNKVRGKKSNVQNAIE
jgi:hypothetical protein